MKEKLFAKWLPIEGEIKEGDLYFNENNELRKAIFNWVGRTELSLKVEVQGRPKAKLFLVSRDIQVGDKVWVKEYNDYYQVSNIKGKLFEILSVGWLSQEEIIKVIGEISPAAVPFIKEGDEFDEDDLRRSILVRTVGDTDIFDRKLSDEIKFTEDKDAFYGTFDRGIKIKCPWGCFH